MTEKQIEVQKESDIVGDIKERDRDRERYKEMKRALEYRKKRF